MLLVVGVEGFVVGVERFVVGVERFVVGVERFVALGEIQFYKHTHNR